VIPTLSIEKSKSKGNQFSQSNSETSENLKIQSLADNLQSHKKNSNLNFYSNNQISKKKIKNKKKLKNLSPSIKIKQMLNFTDSKPEPQKLSIDMVSKTNKKNFFLKEKMSIPSMSSGKNDLCIYNKNNDQIDNTFKDIYFTKNNFFKKKRISTRTNIPVFSKNYSKRKKGYLIQKMYKFESQNNSPRNDMNMNSLHNKNKYLNAKFKKVDFSAKRLTLNEQNNYTFCENDYKPNLKRKISENIYKENSESQNVTKLSHNPNMIVNGECFNSFSNDISLNINHQKQLSHKVNEDSSDLFNHMEFQSKKRFNKKHSMRRKKSISNQITKKYEKSKKNSRKRKSKNSKKRMSKNFRMEKKYHGLLNKKHIRHIFKEKYSLRKMKSLDKV